jgi:alkaline phosphatase D
VSILGSTQRQWWKDQMSAANTTWKLWGNEVSLLRMQVDGTQAVAGLMVQGLVAANAGLATLQGQLMNALVSDLTTAAAAVPSASKATQTPAPAYTQTKAVLALAGVSAPVFDAGIKPQLDAALPAAQFFDVFLLNADQWDGYNAERKALMKHLKDNAISNVVALTGDIHAFFAGSVMDDYDAASPVPVMVDLVTAGISSNSFYSYFESVVDSSASFGKTKPLIYTEQGGVRTNTFNSTLTTFNSWLKVANTDAQGYALVTLTPAKLSCSFHTLKTLSAGAAPALPATRSITKLEVVAGSPSVTVLP